MYDTTHLSGEMLSLVESFPEFFSKIPTTVMSKSTKLESSSGEGWLAGITYLMPAALSGIELCPGHKMAGCEPTCLARKSGRLTMNRNQALMLRRTLLYHQRPELFFRLLRADLAVLEVKAANAGLKPAYRPNGGSDINLLRRKEWVSILRDHPQIMFWDYTKVLTPELLTGNLPLNYDITYSYSGFSHVSKREGKKALEHDLRIAFVADSKPALFKARPVVDGNKHDLCFLWPKKTALWLKPKGTLRKTESNFKVT